MLDKVKNVLKFLYMAIPVVSLTITVVVVRRSQRTSTLLEESAKTIKQISGNLQQISENLSTRYIGKFPEFMPDIVGKLEGANESILIATDYPGYGIYSNHDQYVKYVAALRAKKTKVNIKVVVLTEKERLRLQDIQFKDEIIEKIKDPRNSKFQEFLRWSGRDPKQIRTIHDFETALAEEQGQALKEDFRNIERKEFSESMPLYLWIVDGRTAIFSIPSIAGGAIEGAFVTQDHGLIMELEKIFNTYYSGAKPINP